MSSEIYNQIIDEAYKNYSINNFGKTIHTKEQFINRIKPNSEFSKKWGLKIEERELSFEERQERCPVWTKDSYGIDGELRSTITIDWGKTPTKIITLTYNNETIESYE
jgi:hypothetical protein